jgi:8-oxo-dGTP pyrophosphatase MutT (NUDIX family)
MLDLDPNRAAAAAKDAATLVLVRDGDAGLEVFCVERHKDSRFLGGAVVFPGGKVDDSDRDPAWATRASAARAGFGDFDDAARAFAVAACRESLEEAAILPLAGADPSHEELVALRVRVATEKLALRDALAARGWKLDLSALVPFARWVTPSAEARRYDTRFFLVVVRGARRGVHDEHETTSSFWGRPEEVLARFERGEIQLAPPTHRSIEVLAGARDAAAAVALAEGACLAPICPRLVPQRDAQGDAIALALPGDPEHEVAEARSPGKSRYVLRGDRFLPEDPPPHVARVRATTTK